MLKKLGAIVTLPLVTSIIIESFGPMNYFSCLIAITVITLLLAGVVSKTSKKSLEAQAYAGLSLISSVIIIAIQNILS